MAKFKIEGGTLHVAGDLDAKDLAEFEEAIDRLLEGSDQEELRLDFTGIEYMASLHLGVLLSFRQRLSTAGRRFVLRPSPVVRELLKMTGADGSLLVERD